MTQDARKVYADIFDMPHWSPQKHPRMSLYERTAIFSPFAALDGYEDMVGEEARFVEKQDVLTEVEMDNLNQKIAMIADALENGQHPLLTFTYFISDKLKQGGSYVKMTERVRKIDDVERKIVLERTEGKSGRYTELEYDRIKEIQGELVNYEEE